MCSSGFVSERWHSFKNIVDWELQFRAVPQKVADTMKYFSGQVMPKNVTCRTNFSTITVSDLVVDEEEGET